MQKISATIGKFDAKAGTVPVTFTDGKIVHTRTVNAVINQYGGYDRKATKARVEEVAQGVAAKIAVGAITNALIVTAPEEPAT